MESSPSAKKPPETSCFLLQISCSERLDFVMKRLKQYLCDMLTLATISVMQRRSFWGTNLFFFNLQMLETLILYRLSSRFCQFTESHRVPFYAILSKERPPIKYALLFNIERVVNEWQIRRHIDDETVASLLASFGQLHMSFQLCPRGILRNIVRSLAGRR